MTDSEIEKYTEQLYNAMKEFGTDEDTLIKVVAEHPLETRIKIKAQYKRAYGQDLLDVFTSELSGDFLDLMIGLYTDLYEFDAQEIHKAIDALGNTEDTLIEIIGTRPLWMLKKIKEKYKNKYNVELEESIKNDTSGDFQNLLITLLQCNRSQNKNPGEEKCQKIAEELYNAGEKKLGTDEQIFNKYFGNCSPMELMTIARKYHEKFGNSLIKAIEKEFSGEIEKLIKTILYANISPSEYFATRIRDSVESKGNGEKILNRVVIMRNEIDIKIIKEYYRLLYENDMISDIKNKTSGKYSKLLLAFIDK